MQTFTLPKGISRERMAMRIGAFIGELSHAKAWIVEIKELQRKRTHAQNAYLWSTVYPAIQKHLEGWDAEDVHEYCLGECFGWERLEGFERVRLRPLKRSSKMNVIEFRDYIGWIQRTMAGRGIYVPEPNEEFEEDAA
jgi:hypothetical protein